MLVERVAAFVRGESDASFEELALELFRFQYEKSEPLRALCAEHGVEVSRVDDWRQVPALPAAGLEITQPRAHADLHRTVIDHSFPEACLEGMGRPPVLSLIPAGGDAIAPGPGFLADHVLRAWAAPDASAELARRGVEVAKARGFLAARQRDGRPTLVLGTRDTLRRLVEALERRGLRFRLPPGSRVVEAGARGPVDRGLLGLLADGLAVPAESVVRGYGAGGQASVCYAGFGRSGAPRPFRTPPWARVRVLAPETLLESPAGAEGRIAVFDLAAVDSAAHLLTADPGIAGEEGFRLAGAVSPTAGPGSG